MIERECRQIDAFRTHGFAVPEVLYRSRSALVLSDLGPSVGAQLVAMRQQDPDGHEALVERCGLELGRVHGAGLCHGRPHPRDFALPDGQFGFFDFEEDPAAVMPLAMAQARDVWLLLLDTTTRALSATTPIATLAAWRRFRPENAEFALAELVSRLARLLPVVHLMLRVRTGRDLERFCAGNGISNLPDPPAVLTPSTAAHQRDEGRSRMSDLENLERSLLSEIDAADSEAAIEAVRVAALGKKGSVSDLLKTLGSMSAQDRQTRGAAINALKTRVTDAIVLRKSALKDAAIAERLQRETVDVSLPVRSSPAERGRIHPITQVVDEITAIFADMGFSIAEGPDIETDYYNFTALNFPEGHPAREMHDTFFLPADESGERKVLRTHTSPVQVRTMEAQKPPIRIIIPGKTYRQDSDATHSPMFHQVEGLVVDTKANVANLRWVLEEFCKAFFEVDSVTMRFRPSFFPFTEPSFEVDIQCDRSGPIVKFGEGTDWMEILGCGMVHPNVLRAGGLDPDVYQGFAWGMGLDRIAMLKYGMPDLRNFFDADVRWMTHYGFRPLDMPTLFGGLSG